MPRILKYIFYFFSGFTLLMAGFSVYLIWFQPDFYFPKPTGQYSVGRKTYHWIDTKRKEIFSEGSQHPHRELMVNIWYPSSPCGLRRTGPFQPSLSAMADTASLQNKPTLYAPYLMDHIKRTQKLVWLLAPRIYSWAQPDGPIISEKLQFPVIIFSHGFGGIKDSNTAHCEELASHGYVVVGVSHTYNSHVVQFPDGRIADMGEYHKLRESKRFIERRKLSDKIETEVWVADIQFVLDKVEQLNKNKESIFHGNLNTNNVGVFGQSFGGSTAAQVCRRDRRVKAGVNLDGSLFGKDVTQSFDKPFMSMLAENSVKLVEQPFSKDDYKHFRVTSPQEKEMVRSRYLRACRQLAEAIGHDAYTFVLKKAGHIDFTDSALFKEASIISKILLTLVSTGDFGTGSLDGFRATEIVRAYLVNFFNKYLKGQASELLDGENMIYPEVLSHKLV